MLPSGVKFPPIMELSLSPSAWIRWVALFCRKMYITTSGYNSCSWMITLCIKQYFRLTWLCNSNIFKWEAWCCTMWDGMIFGFDSWLFVSWHLSLISNVDKIFNQRQHSWVEIVLPIFFQFCNVLGSKIHVTSPSLCISCGNTYLRW